MADTRPTQPHDDETRSRTSAQDAATSTPPRRPQTPPIGDVPPDKAPSAQTSDPPPAGSTEEPPLLGTGLDLGAPARTATVVEAKRGIDPVMLIVAVFTLLIAGFAIIEDHVSIRFDFRWFLAVGAAVAGGSLLLTSLRRKK